MKHNFFYKINEKMIAISLKPQESPDLKFMKHNFFYKINEKMIAISLKPQESPDLMFMKNDRDIVETSRITGFDVHETS